MSSWGTRSHHQIGHSLRRSPITWNTLLRHECSNSAASTDCLTQSSAVPKTIAPFCSPDWLDAITACKGTCIEVQQLYLLSLVWFRIRSSIYGALKVWHHGELELWQPVSEHLGIASIGLAILDAVRLIYMTTAGNTGRPQRSLTGRCMNHGPRRSVSWLLMLSFRNWDVSSRVPINSPKIWDEAEKVEI